MTDALAHVESSLSAIARHNARLNAFVQVHADDARARAAAASGPLAGMTVALKDNIVARDGASTAASLILDGYESPFDATVVERLHEAGAVIVGRTNMDEFGMGSSCEHSRFGPTRNPWNPSRVPGGSSGGSAAAVAAGLVDVALGSDTGGSIRQPAALCGVVGLKPTYGRVSRYGLIAFASSLDVIGPIARTVTDAARVLQAIAGPDDRDATCAERDVPDYLTDLDTPLNNLRIGVPTFALDDSLHPAVREGVQRALDALRSIGARVIDVDLPSAGAGIAAYYIVAPAEASSNLARFDGVRYGRRAEAPAQSLEDMYTRTRSEGFGAEVQRRIMLGAHVLSSGYYDAYYLTALRARRVIHDEYAHAFANADVILTPTTPEPAFTIGDKTSDPLSLYLQDLYTVGPSLAGLPAISVPAGFDGGSGSPLPVGVQLVAPAFEEQRLLRAARQLEATLDLPDDRPVVSA